MRKLHLKVNESKSAVARVLGRKFLGYSFWVAPGRRSETRGGEKALQKLQRAYPAADAPHERAQHRAGRRRTCGTTCRAGRRTSGWRKRLRSWRELDEWLRQRLRAIQLKHWRRGTTIYRELRSAGASARRWRHRVAGNARSWWRNSAWAAEQGAHHGLLRQSWDSPPLPDLNFSNRPVRTRMPGGVGGVRSSLTGRFIGLASEGPGRAQWSGGRIAVRRFRRDRPWTMCRAAGLRAELREELREELKEAVPRATERRARARTLPRAAGEPGPPRWPEPRPSAAGPRCLP